MRGSTLQEISVVAMDWQIRCDDRHCGESMKERNSMDAPASIGTTPRAQTQRTVPSQWVAWYTGGVIVLGSVVILLACANPPADLFGLLLFVMLSAAAEFSGIELFTSSRSRVSVSSIVAIGSILALGPMAGVLTHMASGLMTLVTTTRRHNQTEGAQASPLRRFGFNTGMFVISAATAGKVYIWTGGTPGSILLWSNLLPLIALAVTDTLVNIAILIGVITLQTGQHPWHIWKQDFQWSAPISIAGGVLGGGTLGLAYGLFGPLGLIALFLPVLSTGYAFRLYVKHTKDYVKRLEEMNRSLDEVNLGLLETLGAVIDADDVYTYGHSAQVAVYAEAIAESFGLSRQGQAIIVKAALVHDIGKVGVMDSIIGKPGPLTEEEYTTLKRHPVISAEIVGRMKGLQDIVPLVRHHHEHWDGSGYPDGLSGTAIPLGARILAVADAVEAMCSDRPYRVPRSLQEVADEVSRCSGKQFDPAVVKAFLAVMEKKGPDFFKNSADSVDRVVLPGEAQTASASPRYLKKSMIPHSTVETKS